MKNNYNKKSKKIKEFISNFIIIIFILIIHLPMLIAELFFPTLFLIFFILICLSLGTFGIFLIAVTVCTLIVMIFYIFFDN